MDRTKYVARVVREYEITAIGDIGKRVVRVVEVMSGVDVSVKQAADFARMTVAELERDEWDEQFERETGKRAKPEGE